MVWPRGGRTPQNMELSRSESDVSLSSSASSFKSQNTVQRGKTGSGHPPKRGMGGRSDPQYTNKSNSGRFHRRKTPLSPNNNTGRGQGNLHGQGGDAPQLSMFSPNLGPNQSIHPNTGAISKNSGDVVISENDNLSPLAQTSAPATLSGQPVLGERKIGTLDKYLTKHS